MRTEMQSLEDLEQHKILFEKGINMRSCRICGRKEIEIIHRGTRDRKDIDVLKCSSCGLVFLSKIESGGSFYADGNMHQGVDFAAWRENTRQDDFRRFEQFKDYVKDKSILDFGCGNGGFLNCVRDNNLTIELTGIEQDMEACVYIQGAGIKCYQDITLAPPLRDIRFDFYVSCHRALARARRNTASA